MEASILPSFSFHFSELNFFLLSDRVSFGEVAMEPPSLSLPRKAEQHKVNIISSIFKQFLRTFFPF